jgi:cell filamentation protein
MVDPYFYPGTDILINKEDILDWEELDAFERVMTASRMETLPPGIPLTANGYRQLHRYIFQDVYEWAGQDRTVNIAKGDDLFCLVPYIAAQMARRFAIIRAENSLKGLTSEEFARRAAEHVCELNAIHPFREGNGRTQRCFLERLAEAAGHPMDLARIEPQAWNNASIRSFRQADYEAMRQVILETVVGRTLEEKRSTRRPRDRGGRLR